MKRMLRVAPAMLAGLVSIAAAAGVPGRLVLGGLDPVALAQGAQIKGSPDIYLDHFGYRYLFTSAKNRETFQADPLRHAVQMGGACGKMGPLSGKGSPERFFVHDGRIYLFASDSCRDRFKAEPQRYIDRPDAPPVGSDEDRRRAEALLDKAVEAAGGERLDRLSRYQAAIALTWKSGDKTVTGTRRITMALPDRYREDESWAHSTYGWLLLPEGGYMTSKGAGVPVDAAVRGYMTREMLREPLVILKSRRLPGFEAVAAGTGQVGGAGVSWVDVALHGATTRLGIETATGRILETSYRGRAGVGIAPVIRRYSDFRPVDGLNLPFAVATLFDGKPLDNPALSIESITLDAPIPTADLAPPPAPASPPVSPG